MEPFRKLLQALGDIALPNLGRYVGLLNVLSATHIAFAAIMEIQISLLTYMSSELTLMYCTFLALKSRNALTVQLATKEYALKGERKLFQA
jgi:hypothetical protein